MIPDFRRYETMHALKLYIGHRDRYITLTQKGRIPRMPLQSAQRQSTGMMLQYIANLEVN
jgi:hypothetical protein